MHTRSLQAEKTTAQVATPWIAVLVLGAVFFFTEHTFDVSLQEGFTDLTEDMLDTAEGGNVSRQIAFLALAAFGAINLLLPGRQFSRPSLPAVLLVSGSIAWCIVSVLWTTDVNMTVRRLIVMLCCVIGALGIVKQYSARQLLKAALVLSASFLALGVATELVLGTFRPFSAEYRFSGSLHPNTQSMNLVVLCLAAFCLARERAPRRGWLLAIFCVGLTFLLLTKSRTGLAALVASIAFLWIGSTHFRTKLIGASGILWTVSTAALLLALFGFDPLEKMTDAALMGRREDATSLTLRIPLWEELSTYVMERPIAGYGFESFWTPDRIESLSDSVEWGARESHSRYIDTLLALGLVGLVLMLATTFAGLTLAWALFRQTGEPGYGFICGVLVFGLVDGITESGMVAPLFATFLSGVGLLHVVWYGGRTFSLPKFATAPLAPATMSCHASN